MSDAIQVIARVLEKQKDTSLTSSPVEDALVWQHREYIALQSQVAELESRVPQWVSVEDRLPDKKEPVVYARPKRKGRWSVGIAYWTVSEKWNPEAESTIAPQGFTHWMPLPAPPQESE